nr:hypothetical protein [uncultured Mediterranean phage uvMED]
MKFPNINYIRKANDLNFCLNRFIDHNISQNKTIYVVHLDSLTKDYKLFRNKIFKNWRMAVTRRYEIVGVGAIEHDSNGYWHTHLLITFKKDFRASTIRNIFTGFKKEWMNQNYKSTGVRIQNKRFQWEDLIISDRDKLTSYLSKPLKHQRNSFSYIPKAYDQYGSFKISIGSACKLWSREEMPSYKYSDSYLEKELKKICKERRRYIFNERYLIKNNNKKF